MWRRLILLWAVVPACACKTTTFEPIEIDLSKRTPAAVAEPQPTPTPASAPKKVSPGVPPAAVPGPESAATPAPAAMSPPATPLPAPAPEPAVTPAPVPPATVAAPAATPTSEQVIEAQLAAYNRRDPEAFAAAYAADAVVYDPPEQIRAAGIEAIRKTYAKAFADLPGAKATITQRLVQGNFIVDREIVSGLPEGRFVSAIVVYEVRDGKIRRAWILR
jgi:hypothetical protein